MTATPKFLNVAEAARMLDLHPMTLKKKARAGEIPAGKSGRKWIFLDVDLAAHIRAQYKQPHDSDNPVCHSISAKTHPIGGSRSNKTENQYLEALGLSTGQGRKNTMTN